MVLGTKVKRRRRESPSSTVAFVFEKRIRKILMFRPENLVNEIKYYNDEQEFLVAMQSLNRTVIIVYSIYKR